MIILPLKKEAGKFQSINLLVCVFCKSPDFILLNKFWFWGAHGQQRADTGSRVPGVGGNPRPCRSRKVWLLSWNTWEASPGRTRLVQSRGRNSSDCS